MRRKNFKILAVVAAIGFVVVGAAVIVLSNNESVDDLISVPGRSSYDYTQGATIVPGEYFDPVFNDITGDYRPRYDFLSDVQYEWYFGELPDFPQDFFYIAKLVYDGMITDYNRVGEAYWKQPEFYPGWFKSVENSSYAVPEEWAGLWIPEGYGCYPSMKEISLDGSRGESVVVDTYFRTGFGTNSYQGIIIRPVFPEKAVGILGGVLFEQPEDVEKYFSLRILNEDDALYNSFKDELKDDNVGESDWFTVLKPTHLILRDKYGEKVGESGFPSDWVQLLQIEVSVAENAPSGQYVIAIDVDTPCDSINQEYYYSTEHEYYGLQYYAGGHYELGNRPHFQVVINLNS